MVTELKGGNLGEIHKYLNTIVNNYIKNDTSFEEASSEVGEIDIGYLIKIELASHYRNVKFILHILKSEDNFLVSRAIKKSTWLITDDTYADIINPDYLFSELLPHMTGKAVNKLLLHIRLHLKNSRRVDNFFRYYAKYDIDIAVKWLPHCSKHVIKDAVKNYSSKLNIKLFKRLCEKYKIEMFHDFRHENEMNEIYSKAATQILKIENCRDTFVVMVPHEHCQRNFKFNKKQTSIILTHCPQIVFQNFDKYANKLHIPTLGKYIGSDKIKDFLIEETFKVDGEEFFQYDNLSPLIKLMSPKEKQEFMIEYFVKISNEIVKTDKITADYLFKRRLLGLYQNNKSQFLLWFKMVPFKHAFESLPKLEEFGKHTFVANILLNAANNDLNDIHTVIEYYHKTHKTQSHKLKIEFICNLLMYSRPHKLVKSWILLNEIFESMGVYEKESNNDVQKCLEFNVIYKVLNQTAVPKIVKDKIKFNTFKFVKNKLNHEEKELIFEYLYNECVTKLKSLPINKENFEDTIEVLTNILDLCLDWDKDIRSFPSIINKIKELIVTNEENAWNCEKELIQLDKKLKHWGNIIFEESLLLYQTEETCLNILKHQPSFFEKYHLKLEAILHNDAICLNKLYCKVRVYWPDLAKAWNNVYLADIDNCANVKAATKGLCAMLYNNDILEMFVKYNRNEKIDAVLQNAFALAMKYCRIAPTLELVLDYAQFKSENLSSFKSIVHNMSSNKFSYFLSEILSEGTCDTDVGKVSLAVVLYKVNFDIPKEIFIEIWKNSSNPKVRKMLFQATFNLLCKQGDPLKVNDIWLVMEEFFDNLTQVEDRQIFYVMQKIDFVPKQVRGKFFMKVYKFLNQLPSTGNYDLVLERVIISASKIMDLLDPEFAENFSIDLIRKWKLNFVENYNNYYCNLLSVFVSYVLCTDNEVDQLKRFDLIIKPILDFLLVNNFYSNVSMNVYLEEFLYRLHNQVIYNLVYKKYVIPLRICQEIRDSMQEKVPTFSHYDTLNICKFFVYFLESYIHVKDSIVVYDDLYDNADKYGVVDENRRRFREIFTVVSPDFAVRCIKQFKKDVKHCPSVLTYFTDYLYEFLIRTFRMDRRSKLIFCSALLELDDVYAHMISVNIARFYNDGPRESEGWKAVRRKFISHPSPEIQLHYHARFSEYNVPEL